MVKVSKIVFILLLAISLSIPLMAQEESNDPVFDPWATTMIIDHQTVLSPAKGSWELNIHHRFGKIETIKDLFGIYAPSNIRMGINYGVTDKIMVGFGTEKNNSVQQFIAKYSLFQQTETESMPVGISLFGSLGLATIDEAFYGTDYTFTNRLSYFGQIIISRKLTDKISLQVAPAFSHFNSVESVEYGPTQAILVPAWQHDQVSVMAGGRMKLYNELSFIFEYTQPIALNQYREYQTEPVPGFSFGIETNTATHCFQVFASNYDKIIPQHNVNFTTKEIKDMMMGFNITIRF